MPTKCVVIGAGILGGLTAYRLSERGAKVTVVEAGDVGSGTSRTGYAHVNASYAGYWDYFDLRGAGVTGYRRLRAELGAAPWLFDVGCLQFDRDSTRWSALLQQAGRLREANYPVSVLTREHLADLEPDIAVPDEVEEILFYTDEGYVDAPSLVADLLARATRWGLELRTHDAVKDLLMSHGDVSGVVLDSGQRIEADQVVCCAGRWTDRVLEMAGITVSVLAPDEPGWAAPGLIVTTTPIRHSMRRMLIADGVNVRPGEGDRLVVWSGDVDAELQRDGQRVGAESPLTPQLAETALSSAGQFVLPVRSGQIESATVCLRSLPRDGLPVVGWVPGASGLYVIAAHAATSLAPAAAQLATGELLEGVDAPQLERYRPARFLPTATDHSASPPS